MSPTDYDLDSDSRDAWKAVERFWQGAPPDPFCRLYTWRERPTLGDCAFFSMAEIVSGAGRVFGAVPQFLPFGKSRECSDLYGFYVTHAMAGSPWPVLYWDDTEQFLRPTASTFEAFMRQCLVVGRYEASGMEDPEEMQEAAQLCALPGRCLTDPVPRNDTELYELLVRLDPQDAVSLCRLGCTRRARGAEEQALDYFHRASEAADWFGDPPFLVADIYRDRWDFSRSVQGWWAVAQKLLPLCTRTWEWDLGESYPDAEIYEMAADGLAQFSDQAEGWMKALPLWRVVAHEDPYDPNIRESLGDALLAQNDIRGAEREYLNALALCRHERTRQPDRLYDALIGLHERKGSMRDASLLRFDRTLPRS